MSQRVELAALVTDEQGRYLVVREGEGQWRLPGGIHPEGVDADIAMRGFLREAGISAGPMAEAFVATLYLRDAGESVVMSVYAMPATAMLPESDMDCQWLSPEGLADADIMDVHRQVATAYRRRTSGGTAMDDRRTRALDVLRTLNATGDPEISASGMLQRMPGLAEPILDFALGEVWSGETLDRKTRSLEVVAMTAALGRPGALKAHIGGALNHGATPDQIVETLRMVAVYGGFPAALDAWPVMAAVFEERGIPVPGTSP